VRICLCLPFPRQTQALISYIPGLGKQLTGSVFREFAVLVEHIVFVLRLFFLVSLLTALVYTIAPAESGRDAFEQQIEAGFFVFAAAVGLLMLTIL
jgi:hypothetical protein